MSVVVPSVSTMNSKRADARTRAILAELDAASRAAAEARAAYADVLADAAELGMRRATERGATSWREAEEPLRALAAQMGAAANVDAREVRRLMNDALLARRATEKTRHPSFFKQPAVPRPGQ